MNDLKHFLAVAEEAARVGGRVLQDWKGRFSVREKGPADLVTDADEASQEAVRRTILAAFRDHDVLAEEDRALKERKSDYRWIVDPLDGTTNYVHGVPHYAVSVAMEHNGRLIAAAVYDPTADECFTAGFGDGAGERDADPRERDDFAWRSAGSGELSGTGRARLTVARGLLATDSPIARSAANRFGGT